ncbi:PREDICTED: syndecan-2 [Corvus brachyrhynchos]|nr:PREDICTED: syndecan-2 [Corvus brachyrhynchos]
MRESKELANNSRRAPASFKVSNAEYKLQCATINLENRSEDEETAVLENCYPFNHSLLSVFQRTDLTSDKDLYLDNSSVEEASGVYPIDDDDYSSGSGSGAEEDEDSAVITTSRTLPKLPTTSDASRAETTTVKMQTKVPAQTKSPEEIDKEERPEMDAKKKSDEPGDDTDVFTQKHSENLFQRTEVLAAVIAGGVIGFLFAIFLILLLVYRMRKKDEGSYDLGERKPSCAAYQKAPTKEFYA